MLANRMYKATKDAHDTIKAVIESCGVDVDVVT
jgi:hypothetical protein